MSSITNLQARNLWLHLQGMATAPCSKPQQGAFSDRIAALGMVQLDSIGILARAHHHILWSRQSAYRSQDYDGLMQGNRAVFEHFSHDASILPMSTYPYWQRQHQRRATAYKKHQWGLNEPGTAIQRKILKHIDAQGPVCSSDLAGMQHGPVDKTAHAWNRPSHKKALDYLWLTGSLSVSHRDKFRKYYDLSSRVIPPQYLEQKYSDRAQIDWLCSNALERLGFANASELQRFWDACDLAEVRTWLEKAGDDVMRIEYKDAVGGTVQAVASAGLEEKLSKLPTPSSRVRIVNPFDPIVRDRDRLKRLFGFDYRIEIYTPAEKRRYGYYVYPMLEGSRFIGRIDVRADRKADTLAVRAWWLEPGVRNTSARQDKIHSELNRLCKLAKVSNAGELPPVSTPPP